MMAGAIGMACAAGWGDLRLYWLQRQGGEALRCQGDADRQTHDQRYQHTLGKQTVHGKYQFSESVV
jgi:hypothetical protein